MKSKQNYEKPELSELDISPWTVICTSPEPGGNEDIGFEDWSL